MSGGKKRYARIDCAAGVAYGTDIDKVREILLNITTEMNHLVENSKETEPKVHFVSMGASSLDFVLRIWIVDPIHLLDVQNQANTLIYKRFTEANIEIPYSKQDVYLYNMPTDKGSL
jgi:small-conductance mechanosensitive channel